jgi:Mn2+/Fe2+ NRAMP family transporter
VLGTKMRRFTPVQALSFSYAVAGTFGWPASLWKQPWQNEGFYLILTGALLVSLVVAFVGIDPVQLMFWANVLQGVLSPVLVVLLIMGSYRLGRLTDIGLILIGLVMSAAAILLFYGLFFGRAGQERSRARSNFTARELRSTCL